jgi:hypothetical protein
MQRAALEVWKSRDECRAARDLVVKLLDRRQELARRWSEDIGLGGVVDG